MNIVTWCLRVLLPISLRRDIRGLTYDMLLRRTKYLLNKQEVLETLTNSLEKPPYGNIEKHMRGLRIIQTG